MHDDPDRDLFVAWRSGDAKAGDTLCLRHFDAVYGFLASKVGDTAEDLVQQTWVRLLKKPDNFAGEGSFRGYLLGIARNVLLDHLRAKKRRNKRQVDADVDDILERTLDDFDVSPLGAMAERQEVVLFARALRRIPIDHQILFELYYWQKLPAPQLATILELPEGTVRSRLQRAKDLVREQIGVLASSPAELASTLSGFDTWSERVRATGAARRASRGPAAS